KSIFPKIDYIIKNLPDWMLPPEWSRKKPSHTRKDMSFVNTHTGKAIEGETCNENFSRGGRFSRVWVDAFSTIKLQELIHTAVGNATKCFIYTTTPCGIEMFAMHRQSGDYDVFKLHWTDNYLWQPKGHSPDECDWENGKWPEKWICAVGCRVHPNGGMPHSERYDHECRQYGFD